VNACTYEQNGSGIGWQYIGQLKQFNIMYIEYSNIIVRS